MAKPATDVVWPATGHITEPPPSKKTEGWLGGEQPPSQFINWLFKALGEWTTYAKNLESTEQLTWALSQIFNKAITLGDDFEATEADAVSPRLIAEPVSSATADHTCIGKFKDARMWSKGLGSDSAWSLSVNATRTTDGTDKWAKITSSQPAIMLQVSRDGLSVAYMPATQNTNWTDAFLEGEGTSSGWGRIFFLHSTQVAETDADQDIGVHNNVVNSTSERKLLWTIKNATGFPVRLYYNLNGGALGGSPGFEVSINCSWGNASNLWTHSVNGICALYRFDVSNLSTFIKPTAVAGTTFADTVSGVTWINSFNLQHPSTTGSTTDHTEAQLDNGHIKVTNTKAADLNDANPPAQTSQANKIGVRNVDKVEAKITSGGSPSVQSGYNLATSNPVTTLTNVLTLHFGTSFDGVDDYECTVTCQEASTADFYLAQIVDTQVNQVSVAVCKLNVAGNTVDLVDLGATAIKLHFKISGKQTT